MQATMNSNAYAPSLRLQFARRGYMVRSEKRRRPEPQRPAGQGGGRPPRRRRPQAGFVYKLFMILLLLTLWPFGLIMLWNRRLRWNALTKLFTAVITLMACILLIGTALTVKTSNPQLSAVQAKVNHVLDIAADSVIDFGAQIGNRVERSAVALSDLRLLYGQESLVRAADTIDQGVALAQELKGNISEFFANLSNSSENSGDAPEETPAPAEDGDAPELPDDEPDAEAAPTSAPAAVITVGDGEQALPVYIPDAAPGAESGAAVVGGMLSRAGILEPGALPEPTPEPEPESYSFWVKPAGEAIVYFNIGSGQYYHVTNVCGPMKNADTHTFAETAQNIHEPCERCTPPAKELLEETYIVWLDANSIAHLTDECAAFEGQWSILSAAAANEAEYAGCAECGADRYLAALRDGKDVTLDGEPSAPAEEPVEEETPAPEAQEEAPDAEEAAA